jgi:hypothetical protein
MFLVISGELSQACLGNGIFTTPERRIGAVSVIRKFLETACVYLTVEIHIPLIKQFMQSVMMLTISVKKFYRYTMVKKDIGLCHR